MKMADMFVTDHVNRLFKSDTREVALRDFWGLKPENGAQIIRAVASRIDKFTLSDLTGLLGTMCSKIKVARGAPLVEFVVQEAISFSISTFWGRAPSQQVWEAVANLYAPPRAVYEDPQVRSSPKAAAIDRAISRAGGNSGDPWNLRVPYGATLSSDE